MGLKQASDQTQMKRTLMEATKIYNELNLFEDSMQLCRKVGDSELLVQVALEWINK